MNLLGSAQLGLVNPGLTSDQIITLLRKYYGNREFKNRSTDKKLDIRFKTAMKHVVINQNRGDTKLYISTYGRYLTWIPAALMMIDGHRTYTAAFVRSKLKADFEQAARTGNSNVS